MVKHTDEEIKKKIISEFERDSRIDTKDIDIIVKNANVLLNGNVISYEAKRAAEDICANQIKVKKIENKLNIVLQDRTKTPSKEEIIESIRKSFLLSPDLNQHKLDAHFEKNKLVLSGVVNALWKTIKAEEIARQKIGVNEIINQISVKTQTSSAANDVRNQILNSIKQRFMFNTDNVKIKLENGNAILQGIVPTWAIKKSIYEIVLYTTGIESITDNLTVEIE